MAITPAQIRGARGLLNWSQADLEGRSGISKTSIGAIEKSDTRARQSTLTKIQQVFEESGIEFLPNDGVRIRSAQVSILRGRYGLKQFSLDIINTAKTDERDILQAYVDDKRFAENLPDEEAADHVINIFDTLKTEKKFKILQRKGDNYFPAKFYADYKWVPSQYFLEAPFYVYGDKMALLVFEPEPLVIVHMQTALANAYRRQFQLLWEEAITPPQELIQSWVVPDKYKKFFNGKVDGQTY